MAHLTHSNALAAYDEAGAGAAPLRDRPPGPRWRCAKPAPMDLVSIPRAVADKWTEHRSIELRVRALVESCGGRLESVDTYTRIRSVPVEKAELCAARLRALYGSVISERPADADL